MNIYLHEVKAYQKTTLIWTVSLLALAVLFMSMFPSIAKDVDEVKKMLEDLPESVRKAMGLEIDNFGSIVGYYSYTFLYFSLCGAIQAMNIGTAIVSKEVREKTADFLLTKPVTRTRVLTSKILAALTSLFVTSLVFSVGSSCIASQVATETYSTKAYMMISATMFFVQLIFLAIGIMVSVIVPKIKSVLTISLGTVFAFYIGGMLIATSEEEALRYLSPFSYFEPAYIMKHVKYETSFVVAGIGIVLVAIFSSYFIYNKRDIHAV